MKRIFPLLAGFILLIGAQFFALEPALAAGSITPSGGGKFNAGATFTITIKASGATFDSLQGKISVSGPVSIVSFSAGAATWLPGKAPANNNQFVGISSATSSLTVATIKLKGTSTGSGAVTVSGVRLARSGGEVGTGGGSTSFTITPALAPPGGVTVTSSSHPDQAQSYDASTIELAWSPPANGATGYSYLLDQTATTEPAATIKDSATSVKYENQAVGIYYFHIRANNKDGWSAATHYKITIKPTTDSSLATPAITSITTTDTTTNDIEAGTVTGIQIKGTGPAGYAMTLTFAPDLALALDKYPAPIVTEAGDWELNITDPVKAGYYKLTAQGRKDSTVSPSSPAVNFEVSVGNGGQVKIITTADATAAYKDTLAAEATRVAAAKTRSRIAWGALIVLILVGGGILARLIRQKLPTSARPVKKSLN